MKLQKNKSQSKKQNLLPEAIKGTIILMIGLLIFMMGCGKKEYNGTQIRVGSLKGPTSIGLLHLIDLDSKDKTANDYTFDIETQADTLLPLIIKGDLDIALVPANVASILYQKTEGEISVIDINTLGVLYMVSGDSGITSLESLKGKTIYLTGKGTTPDYVIQYLLTQAGILDDVTLEYKSEATEVAALLSEDSNNIGLLPQPFATVALAQNNKLTCVLDLNKEWNKLQGDAGSSLVTGVTIVRDAFLEEHEDAVLKFMEEHKASAEFAKENPADTATLMVDAGIIEKASIAEKAIPLCNITYLDGEAAKTALEGYLTILFEENPESVGGSLPGDDFYYNSSNK